MIKLSTFATGQRIVSDNGTAAMPFLRWINDTVKSIQAGVNDLSGAVEMIVEALRQAGIAVRTANEAKAAAEAAAGAAAGAGAPASLANSYVLEANVLSAAIEGATATITIANHTRVYGDGLQVAVTGGSIPGLAPATQYYVSYLDPSRSGGVVTYDSTTNSSEAGQTGDRHLVGGYATPSTAGAGGGGGTTRPPGVPSWKFPDNVAIE